MTSKQEMIELLEECIVAAEPTLPSGFSLSALVEKKAALPLDSLAMFELMEILTGKLQISFTDEEVASASKNACALVELVIQKRK